MSTIAILRDMIRTLSDQLVELEKDQSAETYINLASLESARGSDNKLVLEQTLAKWTLVQSTLLHADVFVASEIQVLQTATARLHNASQPAVALPNEILDSIFEMANAPGWKRTTRHAIASTCYRWRNVAISTPSLWATINLGFSPDRPWYIADSRTLENRISLWNLEMARSKNHPIRCQLNMKGRDFPLALHQQQWTAAVRFIASHVEQCTSMDLGFFHPPNRHNFIWPSEAISNLQYLEIFTIHLEEAFLLDLRKSQQLARLVLRAEFAPPYAPPFQLEIPQNLYNLTHLSGWTAFGPEDLSLLVESAPNLEYLTISLRYNLPLRPLFTLQPMNRLNHLCVAGPFYWTVIRRIVAPLLSSLRIRGGFVDNQNNEVETPPELSTQFPLLKKLDFDGDAVLTQEQLQPFMHHPCIEELRVQHLFQFARVEDLKGGPNAPFPRVRRLWGGGSVSGEPSEASQLAPLFQSRLSEDFILHWIPSNLGLHAARREKLLREMAEKFPRHLKIEQEKIYQAIFNIGPATWD
ncbi:hypothetical protein DL93DRAFT_2101865 [Clavulina sp. PMI_390]|nr:hypothetical protein DL93DRAFT_2101865 [Clavulina sp. PMI_390]